MLCKIVNAAWACARGINQLKTMMNTEVLSARHRRRRAILADRTLTAPMQRDRMSG